MINKIWGLFLIIGIIYSLINNINLNEIIFSSASESLDMILKIFPITTLWLGLMNIAKESGLLTKLSQLLSPVLRIIFPEIPKNHESISLIASNIVINFFGLGNAATPFGLKAMQSLQEINSKKDTASRSMITFLVINTTGLTLIPTTVISLRMFYGSSNPTLVITISIFVSLISLAISLLIDNIIARKIK